MTTDMENELRALFREKAGEAPTATPAAAPQRVLRRGRLHQVGTVVGSALVVAGLIVGSVAGLTRILGEGAEDRVGDGDYEIFERTATIEAFTVTGPSDWFLVNHWPPSMRRAMNASPEPSCTRGPDWEFCLNVDEPNPQPFGLPVFQLSNEDIGLEFLTCGELASDMAALYVALDHEAAILGVHDPSIGPWPGIASEGTGPCGPGTYARFTVNDEPFFAWIGFGASVREEDRAALLRTYESLIVDDAWEPTPQEAATSAYVLAGGTSDDGEPWRLELRPSKRNVELTLMGAVSRGALPGVTVPETPIEWCCDGGLTDPIFGAVTEAATGVEFRPGTGNESYDLGGSPVPGRVLPIPPSLGPFGFDLFFVDPPQGAVELGGQVVALGVDRPPVESPPPVAGPRDDVVELSGTFDGQAWTVRFTGAFDDGSACLHVTIDRTDDHCPTGAGFESWMDDPPSLVSWLVPGLYLSAGSVPPEVVEIRFVGDDDAIVPQQFHCAMGPLGWTNPDRKVCVVLLPSSGSGTLEYLDASGTVLFEEGIAWGIAEPEAPAPIDPVHGGTYWAVYLWLGSYSDPQAQQQWMAWSDRTGGHVSYGDLACDEGAAEALGTDAAARVAAYFDTEQDANAFALAHGLLGHEAGPVIARVTTYCLD